MLHKLTSTAAFLTTLLATPWLAQASELHIQLVESASDVTLQVRPASGDDPVPEPRKVITSRQGALLFFPDQQGQSQRMTPEQSHRLRFAQVGQNRDRLAIRLTQGKRAKGRLSQHLEVTENDGGYDIRIRDRLTKEPPPPVEEPLSIDRAETLALLEAKLDGDEVTQAIEPLPEPTLEQPLAAAEAEPQPETTPLSTAATIAVPAPVPPPNDPPALMPLATAGTDGSSRAMWPYAVLLAMTAIGGLGWWWRQKRTSTFGPGMDVISRIPLGPRQQIVWLQAGGRQFLVGASDQGISLLTEFGSASEAPPALPAAPDVGQANVAAFKARLNQALGRELRESSRESSDNIEIPEHLTRLLGREPAWTMSDAA